MSLKSKPTQCTWICGNPRVRQAYCKARVCRSPGCGSAPASVIFFYPDRRNEKDARSTGIWNNRGIMLTLRPVSLLRVQSVTDNPAPEHVSYLGGFGARMKLKSNEMNWNAVENFVHCCIYWSCKGEKWTGSTAKCIWAAEKREQKWSNKWNKWGYLLETHN